MALLGLDVWLSATKADRELGCASVAGESVPGWDGQGG